MHYRHILYFVAHHPPRPPLPSLFLTSPELQLFLSASGASAGVINISCQSVGREIRVLWALPVIVTAAARNLENVFQGKKGGGAQ